MKTNSMRSPLLFLYLLAFSFMTCEKAALDGPTIVYKTSFEHLNALADDGWSGWFALAAEGIGDSCLLLQPQWVPSSGQIEKVMNLPDAQGTYELTFWSKTENWVGEAYLIRRSPSSNTPFQSVELNTADWQQYTFTFSPDLAADEDLVVLFSAGGTEVASGNVYIDELLLRQIVD